MKTDLIWKFFKQNLFLKVIWSSTFNFNLELTWYPRLESFFIAAYHWKIEKKEDIMMGWAYCVLGYQLNINYSWIIVLKLADHKNISHMVSLCLRIKEPACEDTWKLTRIMRTARLTQIYTKQKNIPIRHPVVLWEIFIKTGLYWQGNRALLTKERWGRMRRLYGNVELIQCVRKCDKIEEA